MADQKKRKSKLAGRLAFFEEQQNTGGSPKKRGKRASIKTSKANMWENKIQNAKSDTKAGPSPKKRNATKKAKAGSKQLNENSETNGTTNDKNDTTTTDGPDTKQQETPKKPKKIGKRVSALGANINLAALKPGGGGPPSLKKKKEATSKPAELVKEEFPRVVMKVDRRSRSPGGRKKNVLELEEKTDETKDEATTDTAAAAETQEDTEEAKTAEKIDDNTDEKTENATQDTTEETTEETANDKTEDKPEDKPEDTTEDTTEDKIEDKTEDKAANSTEKEDDTEVDKEEPAAISTENALETNDNDENSGTNGLSIEKNAKESTESGKETLGNKLKSFLKENFIFDEAMLMPGKYLLLYLKDICDIDLSNGVSAVSPASEDDTFSLSSITWDNDRLNECILNLFGKDSIQPFGYSLRLLKKNKDDNRNETNKNNDNENGNENNSEINSDDIEHGSIEDENSENGKKPLVDSV